MSAGSESGLSDAIAHDELSTDERAELERLRREAAARPARRSRRRFNGKSIAAGTLVTLGCLLAPLALISVWLGSQVADTDRFVATMSPLVRDPAVGAVLTNRATDAVFERLDVRGVANGAVDTLAAQGLPPRATDALYGLTGPLESGVRNFAHSRIGELFGSDRFAAAWDRAIRIAHTEANGVLSGSTSAVSIRDGEVVLDLAPFIDVAKTQLVSGGLTIADRVPELHPEIPIADATVLVQARTAYSLLNGLSTWLPWIALVLLAAGVFLARRPRRTLLIGALGVAASMLLLAAVLAITRAVLVGAVPAASADATAAAFDLVVRFLRDGLRTVLVLGLVVALGAFLTGPSPTAVRLRAGAGKAVQRLRTRGEEAGLRTGRVGTWVHTYRGVLRGAAVGIAVLIFVFLDQPGGAAVLTIALVLLLCLAIIQFLDRPPAGA